MRREKVCGKGCYWHWNTQHNVFSFQNWWHGSLWRHRLLWLWGKWYELPWSGDALIIQHVKTKIIIIVIAMGYGPSWSAQNTHNRPNLTSVWLLKRWRGWVLQSVQATSPSPTSASTTSTRCDWPWHAMNDINTTSRDNGKDHIWSEFFNRMEVMSRSPDSYLPSALVSSVELLLCLSRGQVPQLKIQIQVHLKYNFPLKGDIDH